MKETQQQVQSIQNILVGGNVLVFLCACPCGSEGEELLAGLPSMGSLASVSPRSAVLLDSCPVAAGSAAAGESSRRESLPPRLMGLGVGRPSLPASRL